MTQLNIQLKDYREKRKGLLAPLRAELAHYHKRSYCWTVNVSSTKKIPVVEVSPPFINRRLRMVKWELLTPLQQVNWYKKYYLKQIMHGCDYSCFFELTQKDNVHCHMLVNTLEPDLEYAAISARKWCRQYSIVSRMENPRVPGALNFIHTWEQKGIDQWIDYVTKDYITCDIDMLPVLHHEINFSIYNI